ncbi:hypothetical protein HY227_02895 [Candidatus Wolfebacteria bacterium]|nr:hypothetical protein [Candidatus Wolfebacteria bacterium]
MQKEAGTTQKFVDIENIENGVVFLKSGGMRRVLMVSGINFDLKSEEEQGVIIFAYQSFLNTLDFPLQMVVHSRKINIESYLDKLTDRQEKESNEFLKNQVSEYVEFIKSFVSMNAVMTKNFFVVVPYDPANIAASGKNFLNILGFGKKKSPEQTAEEKETLEQKFSQLDQRTDQIINGLNQIGLRAVALNDEELTELFYNLYNPETTEKKKLKIAKE